MNSDHSPWTRSATLKAKAESLVDELAIQPGSDWLTVIGTVEGIYGKPIQLRPVDDGQLAQLTGLWVDTKDLGIIHYRSDDPFTYQAHSIGHELGHILMRHEDCLVLRSLDLEAVSQSGMGEAVQRARARGLLHDAEEELAEQVAYVLARRLLRPTTTLEEEVLG